MDSTTVPTPTRDTMIPADVYVVDPSFWRAMDLASLGIMGRAHGLRTIDGSDVDRITLVVNGVTYTDGWLVVFYERPYGGNGAALVAFDRQVDGSRYVVVPFDTEDEQLRPWPGVSSGRVYDFGPEAIMYLVP